jgi:aryl-alcohol dehydrogenase-like predicted oxidoreductase
MKYRRLGKTNLKVSVIGIGTWQFGGEWGKTFTQDEVNAIFARAKDLGINLIDTAECYGDHLSESLIGNATHADRQSWVLATKFGHKYLGYQQRTEPRSPRDVRQQLEDSLRALRTDYVDLYQYHSWGDDQFFDQGVHAELERAKQEGKVRHIGNSVRAKGDPVPQVDASTRMDVETLQIVYNRLTRDPEQKAFPLAQQQDLGVLARVPLASGLLTGKYPPGTRFKGDIRENMDPAELDRKLEEVQRIRQTEVPPGVDMAHWATAWCLQHPAVSCVIPGCKSVAQVESNARAADLVKPGHPQDWKG